MDNVLPVVHYLTFFWGSTLVHMKIISKYQIWERCVIKQYFQYLKWFSQKKVDKHVMRHCKVRQSWLFFHFLFFFRKTSLTEAILNERSEHYLGIISRSFPSHFTKKICKIPNMVGIRRAQTWLLFWDNVLPAATSRHFIFLFIPLKRNQLQKSHQWKKPSWHHKNCTKS